MKVQKSLKVRKEAEVLALGWQCKVCSLGNELGTSRPTSSQVLSIYLNRGLRLPVHLSVISLYREFMRQGDLGRSLSISFCTETH